MTLTMTIIKIMADGRAYSIPELVEITGRSRKSVTDTLAALASRKRVLSAPVRYTITPEGHPSIEQRRRELNDAQNARRRAARLEASGREADAIVAQAKASAARSPLAAWGGAHG